jgi:hypothetical protein
MDSGIVALGLGTLLAIGALAFVLFPVFAESSRPLTELAPSTRRRELNASEQAVEALREVEFDRATGKLSDDDYRSLKTSFTREAVAAMRAEEAAAPPTPSSDAVEEIIFRYRTATAVCPDCGPRPEMDAEFCSSCGRSLAASCASCGAPVAELGASFCSSCGVRLAG